MAVRRAGLIPPLLAHLDACLARMTYFGRAESITEIRRLREARIDTSAHISLKPHRSGNAVPVSRYNPTRQPGPTSKLPPTRPAWRIPASRRSRWMYAERPPRPRIRPMPRKKPGFPPTQLIQFAIGSKVALRYKDTVLITERFRNRVLGCFTRILTGHPRMKWSEAPCRSVRTGIPFFQVETQMAAQPRALQVSFLLSGTCEAPSRLCAWRNEPPSTTRAAASHSRRRQHPCR